jgi:hypothetical protein
VAAIVDSAFVVRIWDAPNTDYGSKPTLLVNQIISGHTHWLCMPQAARQAWDLS